MIKFTQKAIILIWLASIAWAFGASPVQAAGIGIMPKTISGETNRSWFVYALNPGEGITDTVVINNHSDKSVRVAIESLDAANTTGGGFTLVQDPSANHDLGSWIELSSDTVQIAPNKSVEISFKVTVPSNASIGQHSGAISIYEIAGVIPGQVGLKVRMGARVYVTVPGKVNRKLIFTGVSHKDENEKLVFVVDGKNESNVNLEPALDINVRGLFRNILQIAEENGTYLPGSAIHLKIPWQKPAPKIGYYRVKLVFHTWSTDEVLSDGTTNKLADQTFSYHYSFWVGGQLLLIVLLGLIFGWLCYRVAVYLVDSRKYRTKIDIYTVKAGETVMHVAETKNVFPQVITKFNRLVWPYTLNTGDRLILPIGWLSFDELVRKLKTEPKSSFWEYLISWRSSLYHPAIKFNTPQITARTKSLTRRVRRVK